MWDKAKAIVEEYKQSIRISGGKKDLVKLIEQALTQVSLEVRSLILDPIPCAEHPKYKGVRKPQTLCEGCWTYFTRKKDRGT